MFSEMGVQKYIQKVCYVRNNYCMLSTLWMTLLQCNVQTLQGKHLFKTLQLTQDFTGLLCLLALGQ